MRVPYGIQERQKILTKQWPSIATAASLLIRAWMFSNIISTIRQWWWNVTKTNAVVMGPDLVEKEALII